MAAVQGDGLAVRAADSLSKLHRGPRRGESLPLRTHVFASCGGQWFTKRCL